MEERKLKTTAAQRRAVAKYEAEKVKRINCRIPLDLYAKVEATGESTNALILKALEAYLKVE